MYIIECVQKSLELSSALISNWKHFCDTTKVYKQPRHKLNSSGGYWWCILDKDNSQLAIFRFRNIFSLVAHRLFSSDGGMISIHMMLHQVVVHGPYMQSFSWKNFPSESGWKFLLKIWMDLNALCRVTHLLKKGQLCYFKIHVHQAALLFSLRYIASQITRKMIKKYLVLNFFAIKTLHIRIIIIIT